MSEARCVRLDLQDYRTGIVHVTCPAPAELLLEALDVDNGIEVIGLRQDAGQVQYDLKTVYRDCVGADKQRNLVYPFMNEREIFIASGALPYPVGWENGARFAVQIDHLPPGFTVYSNWNTGEHVPAKLSNFFVYCAADQQPFTYQYRRGDGTILTLNLLVQAGKTIPVAAADLFAFVDGYLRYLETNLGIYNRTHAVNILVLQAPDDFEQLANGKSFATGEMMVNGLVCYAPPNSDYLEKTLGYRDYGAYLYDGLAHELTHLYTSTAGEDKSMMYSSAACPALDARLMGEALAGYVHNTYMQRVYYGRADGMITDAIPRWLGKARGRRFPILDWFLLDGWLQANFQVTVLDVFREMVKRSNWAPFDSVDFLFTTLNDVFSIETPPDIREMLTGEGVPDYVTWVGEALATRGFRLVEQNNQFQVCAEEQGNK
ncbi:MAG TPA: hypothetical protein VHP83_01695 [Aggregatilineaceae bacterium]|nr:hypothetical protein [Aggregatilineaceae bacterium]